MIILQHVLKKPYLQLISCCLCFVAEHCELIPISSGIQKDAKLYGLAPYQAEEMGRYRLCHLQVNEPRSEKTGLRGFRPGPTQTGLYSHRRRLEA